MAEETGKAPDKELTAAEVTQRLENAKIYGDIRLVDFVAGEYKLIEFENGTFQIIGFGETHGPGVKKEGLVIRGWSPVSRPRLGSKVTFRGIDAFRTPGGVILYGGKVISSDEPATKEAPETEEAPDAPAGTLSAGEEATLERLVDLALNQVEISHTIMRRDDEEIQRLKEETRSILAKLAA